MKLASIVVLLSIIIVLSASATKVAAQSSGNFAPIAGFDLVAPGTGWAASSTHLYWTASNGHRWRDITPPRVSQNEPIQLAHFTDRFHGWVLLINAVENQPASLEIESTNDRGASWQLVTVDLSHIPIDPAVMPSIDSMTFSDHSHGWILVNTSSPGVRSGALVATSDAGCHWRVLGSLPMNGNISFSSASNGVLTISSPNGDQPVWHTRDGGRSWAAADLPSPAICAGCISTHVDSAHFSTENRAVLTALVKTPGRDDLSSVEYFTSNGGATWKPAWSSAKPPIDADLRLTTVSNGHVIDISAAPHNSLLLKINNKKTRILLPRSLTPGALDRLSIASNRNAWALFSASVTSLVSIDQHKRAAKIITPRASRMERPAMPRQQQAPKKLIIHCTLVSDRGNAHDQAASNDIIRANASMKSR
ncbi:MAG: hypothetical protein ABR976_08485 [Terracidiphilus sp.]